MQFSFDVRGTMSSWMRRPARYFILNFSIGIAPAASAQCLQWDTGFGLDVVNGNVSALTVFDDGAGPALYAGGNFTLAGGMPAARIARWNGTSWASLGSGISGSQSATVRALAVYDDGTGPALYAGGFFTDAGGVQASSIAKWDGVSWSALGSGVSGGTNTAVHALAVYDDGSGPALYVGGRFTTAGGTAANSIAKWDGATWSTLGGGVSGTAPIVNALAVYDDGSGAALYVGGGFDQAGGTAASKIAKWDGANWSALGGGIIAGGVNALAVYDHGTGPSLYAAGAFFQVGSAPGTKCIARWDGTSWSQLAGGTGFSINALAVYDDGAGPALYAGGSFTSAGGLNGVYRIAKWSGTTWSRLDGGLGWNAEALATFDDGSGQALYAGGIFSNAAITFGGVPCNGIAKWSGTRWAPFVHGNGVDGDVIDLVVHDDGFGPALYAGGSFEYVGSTPAHFIGKWNGANWSGVGGGLRLSVWPPGTYVAALEVHDEGSGPALYAAGLFDTAGGVQVHNVAKWDGVSWSALGNGIVEAEIYALASFDDGSGPALYAGGSFNTAGSVAASNIAKWDGANWTALGSGTVGSPSGLIRTLAVFDDGSGPALYAGGVFINAGGVAANYIARWDGANWSAVGGGTNNQVHELAVHDDGSGLALYAGGDFTTAGGGSANKIAKWDGTSWSALGTGVVGSVRSLASHDDGAGAALYVGGTFTTAGGQPAKGVAKWDGTSWSALGTGLVDNGGATATVASLASYDDGHDSDADLFVGGFFKFAAGVPSMNLAKWHGCPLAPQPLCFGDGSATQCPCANNGLTGNGCDNSAATGGALLQSSGGTQPDTLLLNSSHELTNVLSMFLQGSQSLSPPALYGDGLRCVAGNLKRLFVDNAVGGAVSAPGPGDPSISERSAQLGDPIPAGATRYYQVYYRDPDLTFCPLPQGNSFNVTNGLRVIW